MAPTPTSSFTPSATSLPTAGALPIAAIFGVVGGGVALTVVVISLIVWYLRGSRDSASNASQDQSTHTKSLSETVVGTPLLVSSTKWGFESDSKVGATSDDFDPYLEHAHGDKKLEESAVSPTAPSILFVLADHDPDQHRPSLSKLDIPPSPPHTSTSHIDPEPAPAADTNDDTVISPESPETASTIDSASVYSQPSAEDGGYYTALRVDTQSATSAVADATSTAALPADEKAQPILRTNTYFIHRMLKDRAGRNPHTTPPPRIVSHIERKGSIMSFAEEPPKRRKSSKRKRSFAPGTMDPLPETPPSPTTPVSRTARDRSLPPPSSPRSGFEASPSSGTPSTIHVLRDFPFPPSFSRRPDSSSSKSTSRPSSSKSTMTVSERRSSSKRQLVVRPWSAGAGTSSDTSSSPTSPLWRGAPESPTSPLSTSRTIKFPSTAEEVMTVWTDPLTPSGHHHTPHYLKTRSIVEQENLLGIQGGLAPLNIKPKGKRPRTS